MAPQGTIQVDNPTPEEIVAERRKGAGGGGVATPPPAVNAGLPSTIRVETPELFAGPPKVEGVDYAKPLGGPPSPFMPAIKAGLEIGGAVLGPEIIGPLKGAQSLPSAVRLAWRMATAGAGAGAGSAVADTLVDPNLGAEPGAPPSVGGILSRAGDAAVTGAEGEGIGAALSLTGKGARRLLSKTKLGAPMAGRLTPEGREAATILGEQNVRPSTVTPSRSVDALENIFKNSLFGGGRYKALVADEERAVQQHAEKVIKEFGVPRTKEETGKLWQQLQDTAEDRAKAAASKLYEDVDTLAGDTRVSLDPLTTFVREEAERRGAVGMALSPGKVKGTGAAVEAGADAAQKVLPGAEHVQAAYANAKAAGDAGRMEHLAAIMTDAGIPAEALQTGVTFRQAHEIRSALGRQIRAAERAGSDEGRNSLGFLKQLRARIDDAMTAAAGGTNSDLRKAYDTATTAWKDMAKTFYEGSLADVAKAEPREVVSKLIKPHAVDDILTARKAIGEKDWQPVAASFAETLFKTPTGKLRSGKDIFSALEKYSPETLAAVFPRGTDQGLWQVARVLKQVERAREGTLSWMIPTAQATAVVGGAAALATGTITPSSAVKGVLLVSTPTVLARIALSPTGRQLLTTGLKAKSAGDIKTATRLAGQLAAWMEKEGLFARLGKGKSGGAPAVFAEVPPQGGRGGGPGPLGDGPPRVSP